MPWASPVQFSLVSSSKLDRLLTMAWISFTPLSGAKGVSHSTPLIVAMCLSSCFSIVARSVQ